MPVARTLQEGKEQIANLCQRYAITRDAYWKPGIKEDDVRNDLIDRFFEALGWDVRNDAGVSPDYRDVVPEPSVEIEGAQKHPDYRFQIQGILKFYVEAKKCAVDIGKLPGPAYQLRRYGYTKKLGLSILTNFEEFAIYDCTFRPKKTQKTSFARTPLSCGFQEYAARWEQLWTLFLLRVFGPGGLTIMSPPFRRKGLRKSMTIFLRISKGGGRTLR